MADYPPKKGSALTYDFPVRDPDGKHVTGASITSTISKDGAAFAATTNAAAEIGTTGVYSIALTGTEMTCDRFAVKHVVTNQPDVTVFGETVTRQMVDLAYPTVSGRSMDVDASGGVEVGSTQAGALVAASFAAGAIDAAALATDAATEIKTAVLGGVIEGTTTLAESIRLHNSVLGGKASGMATATNVFRDLADSKDRVTATTDADGNRTAVTKDLT